MTTGPDVQFTHLRRLTDGGGLYEHACGTQPRREHGYCVDDVARALVVVCRDSGPAAEDLREQYLSFLLASQLGDGRFRNRRTADLTWQDAPPDGEPVEDCWGRALWGLGAVIARGGRPTGPVLAAFERGARWRTTHPRAMAYAAFGAADVLTAVPGHGPSRDLLRAAADLIGRPVAGSTWPWPQPRLTYANAALPEALMAAGKALDDPSLVADGRKLLTWLLEVQNRDGRLSVVPAGGWGPDDIGNGPGFDQQPIEAEALAAACARAFRVAGNPRWVAGLQMAVSWFLGANDIGTSLHDPDSGGGCDGLHADRRNENQGAESTLALLSALQHAQSVPAPPRAGHARGTMTDLVTRSAVTLVADPSRVLARLFVPGQELLVDTESRASGILARILDLPEDVVEQQAVMVRARYSGRHRDLPASLQAHFSRIAHRVPASGLSDARRDLIGAWFTNEYSIEGAALFNPSAVAHPDQAGVASGGLRFVLSLRAVGEGHLSCVEFRTGVFGPDGAIHIDDPGPHIEGGRIGPTSYDRSVFAAHLAEAGADAESAAFLLARLAPVFRADDLDRALAALTAQRVTRYGGTRTGELARRIAACSYEVEFAPASTLAERVLWPYGPSESHGMEDARFVRITAHDGTATYRATYTAFDGAQIEPQVIETGDFRTFRISQLAGPSARNKGMAFFPRVVGGRHVALSRWDRENSAIAFSDDGLMWGDPQTLHAPTRPWELTQTGNCGSPVETDAGWLVLTHGVGPMREYAIGALLLDIDDPTRVIGDLREPLMIPQDDERDGYVPNVVYSCGPLLHGDRMLVPYGASDASVRFAVVDVPALLERMTG